MSLDHKLYNPDLMQGASETIPDDLTVTDTLTVGGVATFTAGATTNEIDIVSTAITTGKALDISDADALTTGNLADFTSGSTDTSTRSLVFIKNTSSSATGATPLEVSQSGTLAAIKLSGAIVKGIDMSAIGGTGRAFILTATTDTPVAPSGTTVNAGWIKIQVNGTSRYIPFHS